MSLELYGLWSNDTFPLLMLPFRALLKGFPETTISLK